jgi:hypothetical protein
MQGVIRLLFFHQNIRYVAPNHRMLYMPFSVFQATSSPPNLVWLTLNCGHSGISPCEPSAQPVVGQHKKSAASAAPN